MTYKIAKILRKKDIITQFSALGTIRQSMRSVKDNIDRHQLKGVYKTYCSCGKAYIGETGHSLQTRLKEHVADITNERSRASALAKHSFKTNHHLYFENASIVIREEHHHTRKVREALEIMEHSHNLNMDNGIEISGSCFPLIREIKTTTNTS